MDDLKLKPCPFCGGEADKETWGHKTCVGIWNRRVHDDKP